ncbi:hypothetical protein SAMN06309944_2222 [Micrococcales bacterium KH10]|nr:hypothetical protein SAMN06309944_2222 [Micrococcales bacterium KH10]
MTEDFKSPSVLLHVGLAKAGTTAIQVAAHERRSELLEHNVLYPGTEFNHRSASRAVGDHRTGWGQDGRPPSAPDIRHWEELVAEVHDHPDHTAFISHEYFADYSPEVCRRIVADLDTVPTVIFTMRNQISATSSMWQQFVKYGRIDSFEDWLTDQLNTLESTGKKGGKFLSRLHCSELVDKWAQTVGPENVIVVALDKSQPNLLFDAFESELGLPTGLLADVELDRRAANRSFSLEEAEMIRAINTELRDHPTVSWPRYQRLVRYAAIDPLLAEPNIDSDAHTIQVPQWAAEKIAAITATQVDKIGQLGVRTVGDLTSLATMPRNVGENPDAAEVDLQTATQFTANVLAEAMKAIDQRRARIAKLQRPTKEDRHKPHEIPLSEFVRAFGRKVRRKLIPAPKPRSSALTE